MAADVNGEVETRIEPKKIVSEFCHLLEKSRLLFNSLRDLPQFGGKHWQTHFGKTFDVYTRLWKFQQQNRTILDEHYHLKRWQIGEIASKIGQLYYHYYLRTSETNHLQESFAFYSAIRSRAYYSQASKEEKPDLMVKKLRYYARYTVVCLLLNKMDLVKELVQEFTHYMEEYVTVYDADDDEEWRLVISEVTAFVQADNLVSVMTPDVLPVMLSHRTKPLDIPSMHTGPPSGSILSLQEIIIIGNCEKQVKFSELTLDMFRMLQALEREPEENPPRTLETSMSKELPEDRSSTETSINPKRPNPHKYLLYKPTFAQIHVFLSVGFKELPTNGVLMVYVSGDACVGSSRQGDDGPYEQGGVLTSQRKTGNEEGGAKRRPTNTKEAHCLYPDDVVPLTRKPLLVVVDCPSSHAFKFFPNLFGQPLLCLMSSSSAPVAVSELNRKGSLFTMFLYSPLVAFSYICSIADLRSDIWDSCQRQIRRILGDILRVFHDWSRAVDLTFQKFLEDDLMKMLILRYVFCFYAMHLHRAFKGSEYYPKCFPKLPTEILINGGVEKQVLELASMLDVRSLFYEVGEAPPFD
ncbi:protein SCAI [Nematostella vectensis]|uniref:protein SCAI n=1 Tax=Nematostella vectensis TaxID=45351 RepID=UPI0020770E29|nr:protein SCAI [Nematostella vectensis]